MTFSCLIAVEAAHGAVERYKNEADYLARLATLGYRTVSQGFESSDWDGVRTVNLDFQSLPSVTSQGLTWEAAARDLWSYPTSKVYGVTTNSNWARTGGWGIFEDHKGDPLPTTIRVQSPSPVYGIGGWFNTNPDGQSVGFLFEDRTTANDPGYVLPGIGAMYPGDNPSFGHTFVGIVDPAGFNSVVLTGTLQVNEENQLEGGNIFGADDFTLRVAAGLAGDYSGNNVIDAADYTVWRDALSAGASSLPNDPTPGTVDESDFEYWRGHFGEILGSGSGTATSDLTEVPEPSGALLSVLGAMSILWSALRTPHVTSDAQVCQAAARKKSPRVASGARVYAPT